MIVLAPGFRNFVKAFVLASCESSLSRRCNKSFYFNPFPLHFFFLNSAVNPAIFLFIE